MKRTVLDDYVINKIREIREEQGMSQETLSFKMHCRSNIVSKAERRKINYNIRHIYYIAIALNRKPSDFFPDQLMPNPDK